MGSYSYLWSETPDDGEYLARTFRPLAVTSDGEIAVRVAPLISGETVKMGNGRFARGMEGLEVAAYAGTVVVPE